MKKILVACTAIGLFISSFGTSVAATYGVSSRSALAPNDWVDWGQVGSPWGGPKWGGPYPMSPVSVSSANGVGLNVTNALYNGTKISMRVHQQGLSWWGSFAAGDILIGNMWDHSFPQGDGPGPMTINFDQPVFGLGTQINPYYVLGAFSASIEAFDVNWNSLGQVSFNNLPFTPPFAGTFAPFIGIRSDNRNISHAIIAKSRDAFVINRLDLVTVSAPVLGGTFPSSPGSVGLMFARCEKINESKIAKNSTVNAIQTDGLSGTLDTSTGIYQIGGGNPAIWGPSLLMSVQINGAAAVLTDLAGSTLKKIKVLQNSCNGFDPASNAYINGQQWTVLATLQAANGGGGNNGGGNNGGGNNGGGNQVVEAQGFITLINGSSIALDKEGTVTVINVTNQTSVTLNGKPSTLAALQQGDKAAALYDSGTGDAQRLDAER